MNDIIALVKERNKTTGPPRLERKDTTGGVYKQDEGSLLKGLSNLIQYSYQACR